MVTVEGHQYKTMRYTLSYSPENEGWPSFYEFYPEFMKGMNQRFYTFKGGNLWRHNEISVPRNSFYAGHPDSKSEPSYIKTVFNDASLETKAFKTIALESTSPWTVSCETELETGQINNSFFEKKEDTFYAYIRAIEQLPIRLDDYALRSAQGIGVVEDVNLSNPAQTQILYSGPIDSIMSVGDIVYQGDGTPDIVGPIVAIDRANRVVVVDRTAFPPPTVTVNPIVGEYNLYSKNNVAESNGVRGSYMMVEIANSLNTPQEIFSIQSEVFKSYT